MSSNNNIRRAPADPEGQQLEDPPLDESYSVVDLDAEIDDHPPTPVAVPAILPTFKDQVRGDSRGNGGINNNSNHSNGSDSRRAPTSVMTHVKRRSHTASSRRSSRRSSQNTAADEKMAAEIAGLPLESGGSGDPAFKDQTQSATSNKNDARNHNSRSTTNSRGSSAAFPPDSTIVFADAMVVPSTTVVSDLQDSNNTTMDVWNVDAAAALPPAGAAAAQPPAEAAQRGPGLGERRASDSTKPTIASSGAGTSGGGGGGFKSLLVPESERGRWVCRLVLLGILVGIVAVVVVVVLTGGGDDDGDGDSTTATSPNGPEPAPTNGAAGAPTPAPAPTAAAPFPSLVTQPPISSTTLAPTPTPAVGAPTPTTATPPVTAAPVSTRTQEVVSLMQSVSLKIFSNGDTAINYPPVTNTPEELALQWLVEQDPVGQDASATNARLIQRYALATLYYATAGADWTVPWDLTLADECDGSNWFGIQCVEAIVDGLVENVVAILDFNPDGVSGNNLQGTLPDDLGLLVFLQGVDVSFNPDLQGEIPSTVDGLTEMRNWIASNSGMEGPLPDAIGSWVLLVQFWVDGCLHTGPLPDTIGAWINLEVLSVYENDFSGSLPDSIGDWTQITSFGVHQNAFTGPL